MPLGQQSLIPWSPTTYTSMVASTYKADIDANSSIAANVAGSLYVFPNSPAALNVLVDQAFNLQQTGATGAFLLNGAASALTVSLTAPGSNSYYATIYWNSLTNAAGVIYGASGVTPTPVLPDDAAFIPLALVLLTTGQATVVASNIFDVRDWMQPAPVRLSGSFSTNQTLNCNGASNVQVYITATASLTINLTNLQLGIPISLFLTAGATSPVIKVTASTPSGTAYVVSSKAGTAGAAQPNFGVTGVTFTAINQSWIAQGITGNTTATPALGVTLC
jgi:hypothetical protein